MKPVVDANRIGRNDPCHCGSGQKAKRCCLPKIKALAMVPPAFRQQFIASQILGRPILVEPAPAVSVETTE